MRDPLIELSTEYRYRLIREAERRALPLKQVQDFAPLVRQISQARVVMLGEASHGTREFYEWRALLSQQLIENYGFHFVAVEGDWSPCAQVNEYVHGGTGTARTALNGFKCWPSWLWANLETQRFVEWLHSKNMAPSSLRKVGLYGLDMYSLFESIDEIQRRFQHIDPALSGELRRRYEGFERFQSDEEKASIKSSVIIPRGLIEETTEHLVTLLRARLDPGQEGSTEKSAALFDAQQSTQIVSEGLPYYRAMIEGPGGQGDEDIWNLRDRHMLENLGILLERYGPHSKAIVWAHNTHIGDYRATDMEAQGKVNLGGLARQKWGDGNVALVGFGTYKGEVIASRAWGGPIERMMVPPGQIGSLEDAFHGVAEAMKLRAFYIDLQQTANVFKEVVGQRAIGVIYQPVYERFGNYVPTSPAARYDAFVFIDETKALTPFEIGLMGRNLSFGAVYRDLH